MVRWEPGPGSICAAGGIRTHKPLRAVGFEPTLYACSSTAAGSPTLATGPPGPPNAVRTTIRSARHLHSGAVSRSLLERRLSEIASRLTALRRELAVADEQLAVLDDMADDARLRSLVSETPLAGQDHRETQRHADAMRGHRAELVAEIAELERAQDELLDRMFG